MKKIFFTSIILLGLLSYKSELKADFNTTYSNIIKSKNYDDCHDAINIDYISIIKDCLSSVPENSLESYKYKAYINDKESNFEKASYFYELYIQNETNLKNKIQFHVLYGDFLLKNFKYFEGMRQYSKALLYKEHKEIKDLEFLKLQYAQIEAGKTDILYLLGFFKTSIESYKSIESKIEYSEDPQAHKTLLHIYYKLIDIYVELQNFKEAKVYVQKLEKLTEKSSAISYGAYYHVSYLYYKLYKQYYEPEELNLAELLVSINKINEIKEVNPMDSDFLFKFSIVEALFNGFANNYDYAEQILANIKFEQKENQQWHLLYRQKQVYQAIHVINKIQGYVKTAMNNKFKEIDAMENMVEHQDKEVVIKLKKQIFDMQNDIKKAREELEALEKNNIINNLSRSVYLYNIFSTFFIILFISQIAFITYFFARRYIQGQLRKTKYLYTKDKNWMDTYLLVREKQPQENFSLIGIDFGNFEEYSNKLNEKKLESFKWLFEHFIKNNLRKGDIMVRYPDEKICIIAKGTPEEVSFLCERLKFILDSELHLNGYLYFGIELITSNQSTAASSVKEKIKQGIENRIFINK